MSDALLVVDLEGRITLASASTCRLHGGQVGDLVGRALTEVLVEVPPILTQALQSGRSGPREDGGPVAVSWRGRDQDRIPVLLSWTSLSDGDPARQAFAVTLVEPRQVEGSPPSAEGTVERFEALSGAAPVGIFETDERGQLVYVGVGQNLVAMKIKVGMLASEGLGETGQAILGEALTLVDEAIKDVWSLTFELCPPMLYEVGLTAAIDWLLGQFRQRHGLELSLRGEDRDVPLSDEARGALFQCVRELLQNVVKHAEARRAEVSLEVGAGKLVIQVVDDGAGFVPPLVFPEDADQGSFGLFMVRERMRQLGGRVDFDCAEGRGSRIGLHLPVEDGRPVADDRAGEDRSSGPRSGGAGPPAQRAAVGGARPRLLARARRSDRSHPGGGHPGHSPCGTPGRVGEPQALRNGGGWAGRGGRIRAGPGRLGGSAAPPRQRHRAGRG